MQMRYSGYGTKIYKAMAGNAVQTRSAHKPKEEKYTFARNYDLPEILNRSHPVIFLHVRLIGMRPALLIASAP